MVWRKRDPNESGTPSFGKNTSGLRGIDNRAHKFIKRRTAKAATAKEMMIHMPMSIYLPDHTSTAYGVARRWLRDSASPDGRMKPR